MKYTPDEYLMVFSNCLIVRGASRCTICDLQNGRIHLIPKDMADIIHQAREVKINDIRNALNDDDKVVFDEYLEFLIQEELCFFTSHPKNFPDLSLSYEVPSLITNAILDIDNISSLNYNIEYVINQLSELNTICVQIRLLCFNNYDEVNKLLGYFNDSRINQVELVMEYDISEFREDNLSKLCSEYKRLKSIYFMNSPNNLATNLKGVRLFYSSLKEWMNSCGNICSHNFQINIPFFTEAIRFNSCLNRKIAIAKDGTIKNCPFQDQVSYGNARDVILKDIIKTKSFANWSNYRKDEIEVCKDCEFRYVCMDCRVFITDKDNIFSKPANCSYDPYTATWN